MKSRLFCFGDSFVDWDIPVYHWTTYLSNHYDVYKFGMRGADNVSILFQLGNLPEHKKGDRIIMVFTEPGRLPRRFYGDRKERFMKTPYMSPNFYKNREFAENLHTLKYIETLRWSDGQRDIEVSFFKKLKEWLKVYNPVFVTWNENFIERTSEFVTLIQVSSNYEEGTGDDKDFHPGIKGCYEFYSKLHSLLEINEPLVDFVNEQKNLI